MGLFMVAFEGVADPPPQEEAALRSALAGLPVVDQWPGTVVVEAPQEALAQRLKALPRWSWAPAQSLGL